MRSEKIKCDVGIMAYNEEANIGQLLSVLLSQKTSNSEISQIIVVASGCTDRTEFIVNNFSKKDRRIRLLTQKKREGKASAVNLFLKQAKGGICILVGGDILPKDNTIENLIEKFSNPKIGMVGGHPIPKNNPKTFMGFTAHFLWGLHHKLSLEYPKCGEIVAFLNIVKRIPQDTPVDEVNIEQIITKEEYKLDYAPKAIVYNKGPDNLKEFLAQRRRNFAGHLFLKKRFKYEASTMKGRRIVFLLFKDLKFNLKEIVWIFAIAILEVTGRILGAYDFYIKKKNPYIWEIAKTTKKMK